MEKRIRALKAIILVVVMIVELFGVDAVRVVAETINVTGDTTISTEDNRDYAAALCDFFSKQFFKFLFYLHRIPLSFSLELLYALL